MNRKGSFKANPPRSKIGGSLQNRVFDFMDTARMTSAIKTVRDNATKNLNLASFKPIKLKQKKIRFSDKRLRYFRLAFLVVLALLSARVIYVQGIAGSQYAQHGAGEFVEYITLPATRGNIYDRNGHLLATSIPMDSITADPEQIADPKKAALQLSKMLGLSYATLYSELTQKTKFVYIDKMVSPSVAKNIQKVNGVYSSYAQLRTDTNGTTLESLIGLVNQDSVGISGIEDIWNKQLSGSSGLEQALVTSGNVLPGGLKTLHQAVQGQSLMLSIDQSLQYQVQQYLANQVASTNSLNGTAIVMDTKTGGILAMSSVVSVPKVQQSTVLAKSSSGYVVSSTNPMGFTQVFEPGSVMKIATFTGALASGIITPNTELNVPPDLNIDGSIFHDAESHGDELLSASQVIQQSSNIGTIEIAEKLGAQKLYKYLLSYGFDQPSGLNFPGESIGILKPLPTWSGTAIGSMPIGQDIGVTPIQILDAYNTVANDGVYVKPRLVVGTVNSSGVVSKFPESGAHRVVSSSIDQMLKSMLRGVISQNGTAPLAEIPGYNAAGKTGSAQIPDPFGRGYLPGKFMATFVGFAPVENPALTTIVILDSPKGYYGGSEAGPVFSEIMSYALHLYHIAPPSKP